MDATQRIERLERENRWLKATAFATCLGVGVGIVFLVGQAAGSPAEINARRFVLVDAGGAPRAVLSLQDEGARLDLYPADKTRPSVALVDHAINGPALIMEGAGGNTATLNAFTLGPRLFLHNTTGDGSATLAVGPDGSHLLMEAHGTRTYLTNLESGPHFALSDSGGNAIWEVP